MVEGLVYVARSRHGAPNELARQLVAAGLADRPMVIHCRGRGGTMTYRSFHGAARWTYTEGDQPLRRVKYREQPEGVFLGSGTRQKRVSSPAVDIVEPQPAEARETHSCDGCGKAFQPPRPWSRFCSPACRLRAHRELAERNRPLSTAAIPHPSALPFSVDGERENDGRALSTREDENVPLVVERPRWEFG